MRRTAFLVNIGRGSLIVERELIEGLRQAQFSRGALLARNAAQPQLGGPTPHLGRFQSNQKTDTVAEA
ncbi:hypothetical protein CQ10_41475 [Bradyrhizobium valentinum]|nr:hypothetical protein CQ10_41475 [Bradyrhizobium valentinum]